MLKGLLPKRKTSQLLGIDISSSSVKVLALGRTSAGLRVEAFASSHLPTNAVVEKQITDTQAVADALRRAIGLARTKRDGVSVAVSGSSVISKIVEMPADLTDDELETQITLEADQFIPYPLDEVALDFEVTGLSEKDPSKAEVLVVACRRESVDILSEALELAELTPRVVDVEAYALERAFDRMSHAMDIPHDVPVAIADIGSAVTTLSVMVNGETVYTREQLFGGRQLVEQVQSRYEMSEHDADDAIRSGNLPEGHVEDIYEPFVNSASQQILRSMQFFSSASHYDDVDTLILSGGVASLPGLREKIEAELGVKTHLANPFQGMAAPASGVDAAALARSAPALMIACGLALRGAEF